jgi:integrase
MRAKNRLTDKDAREATTDRPSQIFYDGEVKGFGLRVTKTAAKSWVLNYRTKAGVERRLTIGSFPTWPAIRARDRAKELRQQIDRGGDPLGETQAARAAPTLHDLIEYYVAEHLPKKRPNSRYEDRNLIAQWIVPEFAKRKVAEIKRADIGRLHRKVTERGTPIRANRLLSLLSKMFSLAVDLGWCADNPAKGIEKNPEQARARYLAVEEIGRLVEAIAEYRKQNAASADAIEMLLLTGSRRNEVLSLRWGDVDLNKAVWTKPPSSVKQNREHRIPLSPEAIELLRQRQPGARSGRIVPLRPAEFVFPGGGSTGHKIEIRRAWLAICKKAEIGSLRLHDLRHSYASLLVSAGRSLPEIGALLGHRQVQTTARYSHLFDKPLREATSLVGKLVRGVK